MLIFLADVRVDGKHTPNLTDLSQLLPKIDLKNEFENVKLVNDGVPGITLSFDNLRQSHLFALVIYEQGRKMELWATGPSDIFFNQSPLDDNRFDPVLSMSEVLKDGRLSARVYTRFNEGFDKGRNDKYSELIRDVVKGNMPHLIEQVKDFEFK